MDGVFASILGGSLGAAVVTGLFGLVRWFVERRAVKADRAADKAEERDEAADRLIVGLRGLYYIEIKTLSKQYLRAREITSEDLEDLLDMHTIYHDALHGNGFLDSVIAKVKRLPITDGLHDNERGEETHD